MIVSTGGETNCDIAFNRHSFLTALITPLCDMFVTKAGDNMLKVMFITEDNRVANAADFNHFSFVEVSLISGDDMMTWSPFFANVIAAYSNGGLVTDSKKTERYFR